MMHNQSMAAYDTRPVAGWTVRRWMMAGCVMLTVACNAADVVQVPAADPSTLFWGVAFDIRATTMAVGATQSVVATPQTVSGTPLSRLPRPSFRSTDHTKASVDSTGKITAHAVTAGIYVIAALTVDGVTRADTTRVVVTPTARPLASFALAGAPATTTLTANVIPSIQARDSSNLLVSGLAVTYRVLDPLVLQPLGGGTAFRAAELGKTKLIATTTSYGKTFADTAEVAVLYRTSNMVYMTGSQTSKYWSPAAVVIAVGGSVTFYNNYFYGGDCNVIFTNGAANVTGGNIPLLAHTQSATRTFPVAGTYAYRDTISGQAGTVIVRPQPVY